MLFTLLGSGTSTGVPLPGCECSVCNSTDPKNFRNRTSALLTLDNGKNILIDATPDLRHQAIAHKIKNVDAVLYTHAHADHILGTDDLRSFNFVHRNRIPCYGTRDTLNGIRACFGYIFNPDPNYQGAMLAQLDLHEISNETSFSLLGLTIQPFALKHGSVTVTGFRFGDLGYATDCSGLSERAFSILKGVKTLFLDGLRYEPRHRTHMTIPDAIEIAQQLGVERTYLIHMTHEVDHESTNRGLPENVELGFDGLGVEFS
jgi:phosphoribosyl 1,2-cyclic phosphate phosphodiesterase